MRLASLCVKQVLACLRGSIGQYDAFRAGRWDMLKQAITSIITTVTAAAAIVLDGI